jgi:hypothetical protein
LGGGGDEKRLDVESGTRIDANRPTLRTLLKIINDSEAFRFFHDFSRIGKTSVPGFVVKHFPLAADLENTAGTGD